MVMPYEPPFTLTKRATSLIISITEQVSRLSVRGVERVTPRLRKVNRIRSVQSSLRIENNSLSVDEVAAVLEGKSVVGPSREILEVRNALAAYDMMGDVNPESVDDLLSVHKVMMTGLIDSPGEFRTHGEGLFDAEGNCVHVAPPHQLVPGKMNDLFEWLRDSDWPELVKSCVFHYEFEFIHPFKDGNGRVGRYWQTLILSCWNSLFRWVPVESHVAMYQNEYYEVISRSNTEEDCTAFLELMLELILKSVEMFAGEVSRDQTSGDVYLSPTESAVFSAIKEGSFTSAAQAANMLNLSPSTVSRAVTSLKKKGLIAREGAFKNGRWVVRRSK